MSKISITRKLGKSDYNYNLIAGGAEFAVQTGTPVTVVYNGKRYAAKMHSSTVGRIDGLSEFYKESGLQIDDCVLVEYDSGTNEIVVTKVGTAYDSNVSEPPQIKGVLATLDPVARHNEFYRRMYKPSYTVANGKWIFYWDDKPYLMDENGENKVELKIDEKLRYSSFLGMNNKGLWFMNAKSKTYTWDDTEWWNEIVCIDFENNTEKRFKINPKKAVIDDVYIYDENIYYVAKVTENKQELIWVNDGGIETSLFTAHKGESINYVCANDSKIAFAFSTSREGHRSHWVMMDAGFYEPDIETLGLSEDMDVDIEFVDLKQNIMWTTMTAGECARYGAGPNDLVARLLREPVEYKVLTYKKDNSPAIFKRSDDTDWWRLMYFDGKDAYMAPSYFELIRADKNGNKHKISHWGHGETDKIIVMNSGVLVNYDAWIAVRLPRKFHETNLPGSDNPEAAKIFGQGDYRL